MSEVQSFSAKLISKKKVSDDAYSFYFERPRDFEYLPGQYVKMMLDIKDPDERGASRFFTVSSSPTEKDLMITTRIIESSFKKTLGALPVGSKVQMRGSYGAFVFEENDTRPRVFLAGGIGITPFRSMMIYMLDKNIKIPMTLIASFSTKGRTVFSDELSKLSNKVRKTIFTVTHPDSSNWDGETGRIDDAKLKKYIPNVSKAVYYIAGPERFVEEMGKQVLNLGIPEENIKSEDFPGY